MTCKITRYCATAILTSLAAVAQSASISLVPTSNTIQTSPGDVVSFDVVMDFTTDNNGLGSDITLGGGYDVIWDPAALVFVNLTTPQIGDPCICRPPDVVPGLVESWSFSDFNGLVGPMVVGRINFEVRPGAPASSFVMTGPTNGISGPFVSGVDYVTLLDVDFNAIEVTVLQAPVPLPAAIWVMLSGLVALSALARGT